MQNSARIQSVIELLTEVKQAGVRGKPIDSMVAAYYRSRRYIGAKDRAAITDLFYLCVRHLRSLAWMVAQDISDFNPRLVVWQALFTHQGFHEEKISALFDGTRHAPEPLNEAEKQALNGFAARIPDMPDAVRYNLPDWALPKLQAYFADDWQAAVTALNQQAPIDVRVNPLKCPDPALLRKRLAEQGIRAEYIQNLPGALRVSARFAAHATDAFKEGWYEMQDAGSQLIAMHVAAQPGQKVVDFCAGAGGKTLAMAGQMKNKGRILALDVAENRLKQLRPRLARAGVDNVMVRTLSDEADPWLKRHKASADWVLIDAPCSGSGTWRRNPDLKWRFNPSDLNIICQTQARILDAAAKLVKPGGGLVYATCSLFHDENHSQVAAFVKRNPRFRLAAPAKVWDKQVGMHLARDGYTQLSPHKDGMDGFFVAQLMHGSTE